jgi:prepilin-type N-terminal cleavage/methylation domain-containing protein/prepilin-type processing-associated H-X9-DG protein
MHKRSGFTLIELLVVIAIIALLMAILTPALQRVKQQAKTTVCQARVKQWALYFSMYTEEHDGYFQAGVGTDESPGHTNHWFNALRSYYRNDKEIMCCPTAMKPLDADSDGVPDDRFNVFSAWGVYTAADDPGFAPEGDWGSYGINGWVENPPPERKTVYENFETVNNWRTPNVRGAGYVPVFFDALRFNVFPRHTDTPPETQDMAWQSMQHMRRICIDRHDGFINMAFLDWSVRKAGLKQLWTFKWHRAYKTDGPWTTAGGVMPTDWPRWMRSFSDY